jgi:polyhydroxyalkanoate synthesis regulator phasin
LSIRDIKINNKGVKMNKEKDFSDDSIKNRIESIIDDIENEIVDYIFNLEQKLQELKEQLKYLKHT